MINWSSVSGLWPKRRTPLLPRFVCVTPNTKRYPFPGMIEDPWISCKSGAPTFIGIGVFYIFICYDFFEFPVAPSLSSLARKKCPTIADNLFQPNVGFIEYQSCF